MPWKIAFLFGAIVSVTGPTVVTPILKRLPLTRRLKTTLEAEAVLVDALGVLLTSAVFAFVTGSHHTLTGGLMHLLSNLAVGVAIGALGAGALKLVLGPRVAPPADLVRPIVLAAVLLIYSLAEAAAHEAGIAAVAVAGLIAGSVELPQEEAIRQFKSDLTYIALSLVFILLAASMRLEQLTSLGWGGVGTVLLLMVVVRPVAVALATWGSTLSLGERAFAAWLGPRGIVAASMASLMAVELKAWNVQGAEAIAPLVFLTILLTVLVQGSGAGWVARRLKVMPKQVLIAGADERARLLAHQLVKDGEAVTLVDVDPENVRLARSEGLHALDGDATHAPTLGAAGADWCRAVVVATPSDRANTRIAQAVRTQYPELPMMALTAHPEPVAHLRTLLESEA
jgi:NhaP-type Na+/H+ or K+/H+ antiporter